MALCLRGSSRESSRGMWQQMFALLLSASAALLLTLSPAFAALSPSAGPETSLCHSLSRCDLCVLPLPARGLSPVSTIETCMWDKATHSCVPATLPWDRHGRSCESLCRAADPSLSFIPPILFPSQQCEASSLCPYVQTHAVCHALYPHEAASSSPNASAADLGLSAAAAAEAAEAAAVLAEEDLGFTGSAWSLTALVELARLHQDEDARAAAAEDAAVLAATAGAGGDTRASLLETATASKAGAATAIAASAGLGVSVSTEAGMQALLAAPDDIRLAVLKSKSAAFLLKAAGLAHQILTTVFSKTHLVDCDRFAYNHKGGAMRKDSLEYVLSVASTCPAKVQGGSFKHCTQAQVFLRENGCDGKTNKNKCQSTGDKYTNDLQHLRGAGISMATAFKCYLVATDETAPSGNSLSITGAAAFALLQTLPKGAVVTHVVERRGGAKPKTPPRQFKHAGDSETKASSSHHYLLIGAPGASPNPTAAHPDTHIIVDFWMGLAGGGRYLIHPVPAPQNYDPFFPGSVRAATAAAAAVHPMPPRARTPSGDLAPPGPAEAEAEWTRPGGKPRVTGPDLSASAVGLVPPAEPEQATPSGVGTALLRRVVAAHDVHSAKVLQFKHGFAWTIIGGAPAGYPMPPWSPKMGRNGDFSGNDNHKGQYSLPKEYPEPESDVAMGLGWHNRRAKLRRATFALLHPESSLAGKEQAREAFIKRRKDEEAVRLVTERERWMRQYKAALAMQRRHAASGARQQRAAQMPAWALVESGSRTTVDTEAQTHASADTNTNAGNDATAIATATAAGAVDSGAGTMSEAEWAASLDAEAQAAWSRHVEQQKVLLNEALERMGAATWDRDSWGRWAAQDTRGKQQGHGQQQQQQQLLAPSSGPASAGATVAAAAKAGAARASAETAAAAGLVEVSSDSSVASLATEPPLLPFVDMILAASASASAAAAAAANGATTGAAGSGFSSFLSRSASDASVASDILAQVEAENAAAAAAAASTAEMAEAAEAEAEVTAVLLELRTSLRTSTFTTDDDKATSASSPGSQSSSSSALATATALRRRLASAAAATPSTAAAATAGVGAGRGGKLSPRAFEALTRRTAEALRSAGSPFASYSTTTGNVVATGDSASRSRGGLPEEQARAIARFLLSLTPGHAFPSKGDASKGDASKGVSSAKGESKGNVTAGSSAASAAVGDMDADVDLSSPSSLAALGRRLNIEKLLVAAEERGDLDALRLGLEAVLRAQERAGGSSVSLVGGVSASEEPDFAEDSRWERLKHSLWSDVALRPALAAAAAADAAAATAPGRGSRHGGGEWDVDGVCGRRFVSPFVDLVAHCALPLSSPSQPAAADNDEKGKAFDESLFSSSDAPLAPTDGGATVGIDNNDYDISPLFTPLTRAPAPLTHVRRRPGSIPGAHVWTRARALAALDAARARARLLLPLDLGATATAAEAKAEAEAAAAAAAAAAEAGDGDAASGASLDDDKNAPEAIREAYARDRAAAAAAAAAAATAGTAAAAAARAHAAVSLVEAAAAAADAGLLQGADGGGGVRVPLRGKGGGLKAALALTEDAVERAMKKLREHAEVEAAKLWAKTEAGVDAEAGAGEGPAPTSFVDVLSQGGNPDLAAADAAAAAAAAAEEASLRRRGISPLAARVRAAVREKALAAGSPEGAMGVALENAKRDLLRAQEDGTLKVKAEMAAQAWLRSEEE